MSGTKAGGIHAAATNKTKYGEDYYVKRAREAQKSWEANGRRPRGFSVNRKLASIAGAKGGTKSTRLGIKNTQRQEKVSILTRIRKVFRWNITN